MKTSTTRFLTGLVIIAVGISILLSNFEILQFRDIVSEWWPLLVVASGVLIFINDTKSYLWSLLVVAVGVILQLRVLEIINVNPWELIFPTIIVVIGVSVIFNKSTAGKRISKSDRDDITAILAGSDQRNTSDDFKGSKVSAIMGGVKFDLRKATIKQDATIEIFSFWGGVEIVVPRNIVIKNKISAVLGGVEDKTDQDVTKNAPVLYITGDVIMAGVEIKN